MHSIKVAILTILHYSHYCTMSRTLFFFPSCKTGSIFFKKQVPIPSLFHPLFYCLPLRVSLLYIPHTSKPLSTCLSATDLFHLAYCPQNNEGFSKKKSIFNNIYLCLWNISGRRRDWYKGLEYRYMCKLTFFGKL